MIMCKNVNDIDGLLEELIKEDTDRFKLLPCPWCDTIPKLKVDDIDGFVVECENAECHADCGTCSENSPTQAAQAWNKRTNPWISLGSRRPAPNTDILVQWGRVYPRVLMAWVSPTGNWHSAGGEIMEEKYIAYWMPLPEPKMIQET